MAYGAIGDIIDTIEVLPSGASFPMISRMTGEIYTVSGRISGTSCCLKTIDIDPAGQIGSVLDSYDHAGAMYAEMPSCMSHPSILAHAMVRDDDSGKPHLRTIEIDAAGEITEPYIDDYVYDTLSCSINHIIRPSDTIIAIALRTTAYAGWVHTLHVTEAGIITEPYISRLNFETVECSVPTLFHVKDNIYGVVYPGPGKDGFLKTFSIDPAGQLSLTVIDTIEFDPVNCQRPQAVHVHSGYVAIIYNDDAYDGWIACVKVNDDGTIDAPVKDIWRYTTDNAQVSNISRLGGQYIATSRQGILNRGYITTFQVDDNGSFNSTILDQLWYEDPDVGHSDWQHISGDVYALAYLHTNGKIKVITLSIESFPEERVYGHELTMRCGP